MSVRQAVFVSVIKYFKGGGRVVSAPICTNNVRNGPASAERGRFTASQGSHHVHAMGAVHCCALHMAAAASAERVGQGKSVVPSGGCTQVHVKTGRGILSTCLSHQVGTMNHV